MITVKNVGKNFGKLKVLNDISCEIKKGEIVAIAPDRMHYKIGNNTNANYLSYKGISLDIDTSDIEMLKGVTSIGCLLSIDYDE